MEQDVFQGVEDTLFIPLTARCYVSKKFPEYFYDEKALSLEKMIPQNSIIQSSTEHSLLGTASRALIMDKTVEEFAGKNTQSNIVVIGCGLETMSFRLKHLEERVHFYQIDFPSVIETREKVLGVMENETLISANANELDFSEYMDCSTPTLFVVAGVFQYFKENEVLLLISKLKTGFPRSEIIFDAVNEVGMNYIAKYVKKTGNLSAMIYFYINEPEEFAVKSQTTLISVHGFYELVDKNFKKKLKLYSKIAMKVSDSKKYAAILHLQLNGGS